MARRILNRRELREEVEASQRVEGEAEPKQPKVDQEEAAKPKAVKKPVKRKTRAKPAKEVRLKAFWGVFSQSLNQVAQFEYNQRAEAGKKAADLTESRKSPHFVQLVKKVIEE
jgi:hypothetical protein